MNIRLLVITVSVVVTFLGVGYLLGLKQVPLHNSNMKYHSVRLMPKDIYTDAMNNAVEVKNIEGILVNHHLFANKVMGDVLSRMPQSIKRIVIISPDHFDMVSQGVAYTALGWETVFGNVESDELMIAEFKKQTGMYHNEEAIEGEHGVSVLMPFIKLQAPKAKVSALLVSNNVSHDVLENVSRTLADEDVLVIGSFDFSHYLSDNIAQFHDEYAKDVISSFDINAVSRVENDSQKGLELFLRTLKEKGVQKFTQLNSTNSSQLAGKDLREETTSYITGFFTKGEATKREKVNLLFFGDFMLDRDIRSQINKRGISFLVEPLSRLFIGTDATIINLEGTVRESVSTQEELSALRFSFNPDWMNSLKEWGITHVSLANNHSDDFGVDGFKETQKNVELAGLQSFGSYSNSASVTYETYGKTFVAFIGYHQFHNGKDEIIKLIKEAQEKNAFVVIMAHWGIEYYQDVSKEQREAAHEFIDAGADIIVGAHPHVVQPIEMYREVPIVYSLGNAIFDQPFSKATQKGLALGVTLQNGNLDKLHLFPIYFNNNQLQLLSKEESDILLERITKDVVTLIHDRVIIIR